MMMKSKKVRDILKYVILCVVTSTFLYSEICYSAIAPSPFNQTVGDQLKDSAVENSHMLENVGDRKKFFSSRYAFNIK